MNEFRNVQSEDTMILNILALPEGSHGLEIDTGTRHIARAAIKNLRRLLYGTGKYPLPEREG